MRQSSDPDKMASCLDFQLAVPPTATASQAAAASTSAILKGSDDGKHIYYTGVIEAGKARQFKNSYEPITFEHMFK